MGRLSLGTEDGHKGLEGVECAVEVGLHAEIKVDLRNVDDVPQGGDAGVAEQQLHRAEGVDARLGQGLPVVQLRHVAAHRKGPGAQGADLLLRLGEVAHIDVRHHHVHAPAGALLGQGTADAVGRPGDDRRAALKLLHRRSPPSLFRRVS